MNCWRRIDRETDETDEKRVFRGGAAGRCFIAKGEGMIWFNTHRGSMASEVIVGTIRGSVAVSKGAAREST